MNNFKFFLNKSSKNKTWKVNDSIFLEWILRNYIIKINYKYFNEECHK